MWQQETEEITKRQLSIPSSRRRTCRRKSPLLTFGIRRHGRRQMELIACCAQPGPGTAGIPCFCCMRAETPCTGTLSGRSFETVSSGNRSDGCLSARTFSCWTGNTCFLAALRTWRDPQSTIAATAASVCSGTMMRRPVLSFPRPISAWMLVSISMQRRRSSHRMGAGS